MANAAELRLVLNAVDNASAKINGVTGSVSKLGKVTRGAGDMLAGMGLNINSMINPAMLAGQALGALTDFTKKAVGETVAYNKQIREMTQVTGLGAEEISRIVQVGDDWGISIDALRTSLAFMNKSGVTPSIENLAALADEYVSTADKSAFAEKAVKVLGRGYQTLIPLLAKGGDALRAQTDAVEDNLIATDKSIAAAREYEVNVDKLTDAWTGFKQEVGNKVIPVLNNLLGGLNDQREVTAKLKDALDDGTITMDEYARAIKDFRNGGKDYLDVINRINMATMKFSGTDSQLSRVIEDTTEVVEDNTIALEHNKRASDILNQAYEDLNSVVNGRLGPEMEDFVETQSDLEQQMKDVQAEIDTAISQGYNPLGEKVMGLKGDYNKLKDQYTTNADEHDNATKRIMFDILEQRAAIGGLTTDEVKMLETIALEWGLTDQATLDYMNRADEAMNWLANHPGDVENAQKIISGQETAWSLVKKEAQLARIAARDYGTELNNLPKQIDIHITTYHEDMFQQHNYQHGGSFVIPPGYPNDSYPLGMGNYAQSGERVIIQPAGNTTNNNNFSMNVHTNAGSSTVMRDFNMMKAMAG